MCLTATESASTKYLFPKFAQVTIKKSVAVFHTKLAYAKKLDLVYIFCKNKKYCTHLNVYKPYLNVVKKVNV